MHQKCKTGLVPAFPLPFRGARGRAVVCVCRLELHSIRVSPGTRVLPRSERLDRLEHLSIDWLRARSACVQPKWNRIRSERIRTMTFHRRKTLLRSRFACAFSSLSPSPFRAVAPLAHSAASLRSSHENIPLF